MGLSGCYYKQSFHQFRHKYSSTQIFYLKEWRDQIFDTDNYAHIFFRSSYYFQVRPKDLVIAGRISCASRASLSSSHVNELCCLHNWLVDEGMTSKEAANASEKRSKVIKKFAYINLRLEIEGLEVDEVSDEEGESDGNDDIDSDC